MLATYPQAAARQAQGRTGFATIPAPVLGWNTRDSLDEMDPRYALQLDNWLPQIGKLSARKGYADHVSDIATDIGGSWAADEVETLIGFVYGANEKLLACTDGGIADVSSSTASQVKVRGTYTVDRWQWTVFADSSAPNTPQVLAVNGTDAAWKYDGATHAAWAPTGPTAANLIWVNSWKNRVYAGEKNTRDFWYGALGAIPGTMTRFPLSGIRGAQGNILFMCAMTRDTGTGPDDYAIFVTTEGQAIVYAGSDPGNAVNWQLVGVYQIPRPLASRRSYAQLFGDVVIATELDYVFLSQALQESGALIVQPSTLTGAVQAEATKYSANYGWELFTFEPLNVLLGNVPRETNAQYVQHVINLQTRAASRITGWPFRTFGQYAGDLYGGTNNAVYKLFSGASDDSSSSETRIQLRAQTAWHDFGNPGITHIRAVRPLIRSAGDLTFAAELGTDFVDPQILAVATTGPTGAETHWGDEAGFTTKWGDEAGQTTYWSGGASGTVSTAREWRLLSSHGSDHSLALAADIKDYTALEWLSTDYKLSQAGGF